MAIVSVNGMTINSKLKPKEIFSEIITLFPDLQYRSYDSLCQLYLGINDLVKEISEYFKEITEGKEKASFTRYLSNLVFKCDRGKERIQTEKKKILPRTREGMLGLIYDSILTGFGSPLGRNLNLKNTFGDSLNKNPERQSMLDIIPKNDEKVNELLKVEKRRLNLDDNNM